MVDTAKLVQMLANLRRFTGELRRIADIPRETLLDDPDKIASAKYHFVVAIECCVDIANHIVASERLRVPKGAADSFAVLVEGGFLPGDLRSTFRDMSGFRNRLVHIYWDVDDGMVADFLNDCLDDFDRFALEIASRTTDADDPPILEP